MSRFGLPDGMTAIPDLAQQRVLSRRRLRRAATTIAVTLAVALLNVVLAAIGGLRLGQRYRPH